MNPFRFKGKKPVCKELSPEDSHYRDLFFQYFNRLLAYGSTITDRQPIVEDQVQELFIWLYQNPDRFREIEQLEAYLYAALKKKIISALRKEERLEVRNGRYQEQDAAQSDSRAQDLNWEGPGRESRWLAEELNKLPPRLREVVYLRYYRCLDYGEISTIMDVKVQVARNFASRALRKLRKSAVSLHRRVLP